MTTSAGERCSIKERSSSVSKSNPCQSKPGPMASFFVLFLINGFRLLFVFVFFIYGLSLLFQQLLNYFSNM